MPRIIFANRFFYPDESATSQMLSDLAFGLAEAGGEVCVVTSRIGYESGTPPLALRETIRGVDVHRIWTSRFGRGTILGRSADYATFYPSAARAIWRLCRPGDVVVVKTDPPVLSVLLAPIVKARGGRLVNWLQDIFPEVAEALRFGGVAGKAAYGLVRPLRNRSLRAAAANVVLGARMAEKVQAFGVPPQNVAIIPNWADGELIRPVPREANPLRQAWGMGDRVVVGYSGNLGRAHEIETFVAAIAAIEGQGRDDILWLFIGGGASQAQLKAEVERRGLKSVMLQPYQPRARLSDSLSVADIHLVSLRQAMEGLIVPSKIYGVMAAGRPAIFIGDLDGEVARLLAAHDAGRAVREGDGAGLASAILLLADDRDQRERMGAAARKAFDADLQRQHALAKWRCLLDGLGDGDLH